MKKLLVLMFCLFVFASVAMAKDGPFPMFQSLGQWQTSDASNLTVTITAGHTFNKGRSVYVHVSIMNNRGELIADGDSVHNFKNNSLEVNMVDSKGRQLVMTAKPVYKGKHSPLHRNYSLAVKVAFLSGDGPADQYILDRSGQ